MVFLSELRAYRRRAPFAARCLLVLMAGFYGVMSYANIVSTSHNPALGVGHDATSLLAMHAGGHDHAHDEPEHDGSRLGHHDADHSHDTPNLLGCATPTALKAHDSWNSDPQVLAYPAPCFSFERPPWHLSVS